MKLKAVGVTTFILGSFAFGWRIFEAEERRLLEIMLGLFAIGFVFEEVSE